MKSYQSLRRAQLSSYVRHLLQKGCLHAASTKLIHPQRSLMLQRGAAGVESVWGVIIQETTQGGHVDVWETAKTSGEVGGVVTCSEDAAELRVEQVLCHYPGTEEFGVKVNISMYAFIYLGVDVVNVNAGRMASDCMFLNYCSWCINIHFSHSQHFDVAAGHGGINSDYFIYTRVVLFAITAYHLYAHHRL